MMILATILSITAGATGLTADEIHIRDPFVLPVAEEQTYYLFGSNPHIINGGGFDYYTSKDLNTWEGPKPAFRPDDDFWADRDFWAPEVHAYKGRYYLFASFKSAERRRGTQILVSDKPGGPYTPHSDGPVTPPEWEALDGTLYIDQEDKPWIVFCHEWVQVGDGEICARRLTEDLKAPAGEPKLLFKASEAPWVSSLKGDGEAYVTDGCFMHRNADGTLLMLWASFTREGREWVEAGKEGFPAGYAQSYAWSEDGDVLGPWRQHETPIFSENGGHGMLFRTFDGMLVMPLHAPNVGPNERPHFFEMRETEKGIEIVKSLFE